jgi:hypothetical protein
LGEAEILTRRPAHRAAAEYMQVQVKNRLAGFLAGIEDGSVPRSIAAVGS